VQFKTLQKNFIKNIAVHDAFQIGDFVCVEADRGFDLGVVVDTQLTQNSKEVTGGNGFGRILRRATKYEVENLPDKYASEQVIAQVWVLYLLGFIFTEVNIADVHRPVCHPVQTAFANS
jgi:hypothetical protein